MLGNCMQPGRRLTFAEVDLFAEFRRKNFPALAKERKKGIIHLPYKVRRQALDHQYYVTYNPAAVRPSRPVGRAPDWPRLQSIAIMLKENPNLSYCEIKKIVPCCSATIWKVKKLLLQGYWK